jgi:NAD(P)-dependent dehydrogenase (short-subunit alcohol dehydrogenase family)
MGTGLDSRSAAAGGTPPSRPVAVVTGGGTGLGLVIAEHFGTAGYDLAIASRSSDHLARGAEKLRQTGARVVTSSTDVRVYEQVEAMIETVRREYGRLDVLVNNAAGNFIVPSERLTPNGWRAVVGIVLDGTFHCSRAAFPILRESPSPCIVNIVASYAWMAGPGTAHSAAAKAGVLALTRTLAVEWAPHRIRVNAVAPGPVHTEGTDKQLWLSPDLVHRIEHEIPMRRFGTPDEIADAVTFLAGPHAAYITGQVLAVDGGQWLGNGIMDLLGELPRDRPA